MKRNTIIALFTVALLAMLTGCEQRVFVTMDGRILQEGTVSGQGSQGSTTKGAEVHSATFTISKWTYSSNTDERGLPYASNYFYAQVDVEGLTQDVVNKSIVQVYEIFDGGIQTLLPYVRHYEELIDEATLQYNYYTETVNYFFGVGWVEIDVTQSDFFYENEDGQDYVPGAKTFRVSWIE